MHYIRKSLRELSSQFQNHLLLISIHLRNLLIDTILIFNEGILIILLIAQGIKDEQRNDQSFT